MSYKVRISPDSPLNDGLLGSCYPWWQNFIRSEIRPLFELYDQTEEFRTEREKIYLAYHLTQPKLGSEDDAFIYFDSEEYYTWFVLRWS